VTGGVVGVASIGPGASACKVCRIDSSFLAGLGEPPAGGVLTSFATTLEVRSASGAIPVRDFSGAFTPFIWAPLGADFGESGEGTAEGGVPAAPAVTTAALPAPDFPGRGDAAPAGRALSTAAAVFA